MIGFHGRAVPIALAAAAVFFAAPATAWSPFALSLYIDKWDGRVTDMQVPGHKTSVYGLRIGLAGTHERMDGIAVGLANFDSAVGGEASGFAVAALANTAKETDLGLFQASALFNSVQRGGALAQFAAGGNLAGGDAAGVQVSIGANVVFGSFSGLQASYVLNWADGDVAGVQFFGGGNVACGNLDGVQLLGTWNQAENIAGGQLGLINLANNLDGFQLGAVNVSADAAGMQIGAVNWSDNFDGLHLGAINAFANSGFQIGLLNCSETDGRLLQIGAFNHADNGNAGGTAWQIGGINFAGITGSAFQIGVLNLAGGDNFHKNWRYDTIAQIGVLNHCGAWGSSSGTIVQIGVVNNCACLSGAPPARVIVQIGLLNIEALEDFSPSMFLPLCRIRF